MDKKQILDSFGKLLDIMDRLRSECPWDREQTLESLRTLTIEETYELSEAILKGDMEDLSKELGDILLHIVFYAKIGLEKGAFDMGVVIDNLCDKLIFRHPHVFGNVKADNAGKVIQNWEHMKTKEKKREQIGLVRSSGGLAGTNQVLQDPGQGTCHGF